MRLPEYLNQVVQWLQTVKQTTHAKGFVVGLSGGIDSAVTAFLLRQAVGDDCLGVIMPCESNPEDETDAQLVAETCHIPVMKIDLSATYTQWKSDYLQSSPVPFDEIPSLAFANTKVRLRMVTLYAIAATKNYLVVGTDNWAEWYTGYFTKFGDGGVDLVPLIHLTKGEVWEAARLLGVPEKIIRRKPSAGILPGVFDEDELRVSYREIDDFLLGKTIDSSKMERLFDLHRQSEHKRHLALTPPIWTRESK